METEGITRIAKFMPELVSVEELLLLADYYQARIDALNAALSHSNQNGEQHTTRNEELTELARRRRFLVKTARDRQKLEREFAPAKAKVQR